MVTELDNAFVVFGFGPLPSPRSRFPAMPAQVMLSSHYLTMRQSLGNDYRCFHIRERPFWACARGGGPRFTALRLDAFLDRYGCSRTGNAASGGGGGVGVGLEPAHRHRYVLVP
jgi:hypothetical protein